MDDNQKTGEFWFNTKTGKVERGPQSSWQNRMGPYETEAEAKKALDSAADRAAEWEQEDRRWEEG